MDLNNFRPTTLAAMAADLLEEYRQNGDPAVDLAASRTVDQLAALVGALDADRMIEEALEEIC